MKKSLFFVLTALFSMMLAASAFAQSTHSVSVTLFDASNDEPVSYATVSVTPKGSSDPAKYTLTGEKGTATLTGVKDGTYILAAEMMGYLKYEKEITVKGENVSIGNVKLELDREMLEAAKVTDVGAPVTIKKDTIEYNATAFKTTESDVLEDLLKKLPGVEVNDDGSIVVNGQTVTKVYMEGKTFFMDDPQIATKNIPAKLVEKVKVVQKKSDQAEFTGIDDGQEETVLDLSVVGGTMSGLMANITAGAGHDFPPSSNNIPSNAVLSDKASQLTNYDDYRYQGNLFLGNFTNGTQIFVIGNANNGAGGMGFGGGGGMGGGMMGGGGMGGGFGGGFGGGGVTSSYMLGSNLGFNLFDDKMEASGNYSFNGSNSDSQSLTYSNNHLEELGYDMITNRESNSLSNSKGHSVSMRIEHTFSPSASLIFQPQFSYRLSNTESVSSSSTLYDYLNTAGDPYKMNDSNSWNSSNTKSLSASGNLMYRQRIVIPGRTLTVNVRYNLSNSLTDGLTQSLTNNYQIPNSPFSTIINQRNDQTSKQASVSANATYTEPLGNYFYVEGNYSYAWNHSLSSKDVYNSGSNDGFSVGTHNYISAGEILDPSYSNSILNDYVNQSIGVNLLYQGEYLRAQVGASLRPTTTHNKTTRGVGYQIDTTFTVYNWSPNAQIIWDANDYLNIRFFYRGNSSQPNISQLMPVPDNTNPISISLGNPSLAPYFSHNVNGELRFNNRQKFSSANLRFNAGMVQNPIVNAQMIVAGRTFTMPFNGHDTYNGSLNLTTNNPIFTTRLTLSTQTGINASRNYSYTGNNIDVTKYFNDADENIYSDFNYTAFLSDFSDISNSKAFILKSNTSMGANERLTLTWRADDFDFRIGASTNYQRTWVDQTVTTSTFRNAATSSFTWNWEAPGITFDTDMNYMWYNGYTNNPDPTFLWNMEIEKLLFKNQASISLRGYDLLGQTKNFSLSTSGTTYTESFTNSLGRYIILAFTWRFNSFGGQRGRGGMGGPGMGGGMMGGGMPPMF